MQFLIVYTDFFFPQKLFVDELVRIIDANSSHASSVPLQQCPREPFAPDTAEMLREKAEEDRQIDDYLRAHAANPQPLVPWMIEMLQLYKKQPMRVRVRLKSLRDLCVVVIF